jgi:hypothetical protein
VLPPNLSPTPHGSNGPGEVRQPLLFQPAADYPAGPPAVYPDDPCRGHHQGASTSEAAHEKIRARKSDVYAEILAIAAARGAAGVTSIELADALGRSLHTFSGRLTELRLLRRLAFKFDRAGAKVRRGGAFVLVLPAMATFEGNAVTNPSRSGSAS